MKEITDATAALEQAAVVFEDGGRYSMARKCRHAAKHGTAEHLVYQLHSAWFALPDGELSDSVQNALINLKRAIKRG